MGKGETMSETSKTKAESRKAYSDQQTQDTEGGVPCPVSYVAGFLEGYRKALAYERTRKADEAMDMARLHMSLSRPHPLEAKLEAERVRSAKLIKAIRDALCTHDGYVENISLDLNKALKEYESSAQDRGDVTPQGGEG